MLSLLHFLLLALVASGSIVRGCPSRPPKPVPGEMARAMCDRYRKICSRLVEGEIVGGEDAKLGEFPHHVALGWKLHYFQPYSFLCGGSLISNRFVLTAAHCRYHQGISPTIVRLGVVDLQSPSAQDIGIESFTSHPSYQQSASYHDIALIKLQHNVNLLPACLWTRENEDLTKFIATGYGHNEYTFYTSNILQKVQLELMDRKECENQFGHSRKFMEGIKPMQMCVGSRQRDHDTCLGDSGGPLQTQNGECVYHVVGVTSNGMHCGGIQSQSIYTRVASYIDWIESEVSG